MSPTGQTIAGVTDLPRPPGVRKASAVLWLLAAGWLAVIAGAMFWILQYTNRPGAAGPGPGAWPAASGITRDPQVPTLLLFAHPRCSCTRATMAELERLLADCPGRVKAQVWFLHPAGTGADWTNSALVKLASAVSGVTVHWDENGAEAARFHAATSGQTLLYDPSGHLLFSGGITLSRGHEGDNPGRAELETLLNQADAPPAFLRLPTTPVFGCSLFDDTCQAGSNAVPRQP